MAKILAKSISIITFFFFFFLFTIFDVIAAAGKHQHFSRILSPTKFGLKKEKLSHLHFYFHDTISGPNATAIRVASNISTNKMEEIPFGDVFVIDDPLTKGSKLSSKLVGRAQGIYGFASQNEVGLLMNINYVFLEGKYNGSTLSVQGRNMVLSQVREMPIVGGCGLFRFARGYALAKTHSINRLTAVVEYDMFVFHY